MGGGARYRLIQRLVTSNPSPATAAATGKPGLGGVLGGYGGDGVEGPGAPEEKWGAGSARGGGPLGMALPIAEKR